MVVLGLPMRHVLSFLALLLMVPRPTLAASATAIAHAAAIDAVVHSEMQRVGAKGLALALIDHGRPVLIRTYGARNAANDPLAPTTIMYGASLTKAVFAYTVLRLVDEGKLSLDEPVSAMLNKPLPEYGNPEKYGNWGDLAGDDRWRKLTPRILLTHSSGFANFSFLEPDERLKFHFEPGTRYSYSGEGLILLQFAIEQRLGHSFEDEAQRLTFGPLGMVDSSLHWQDRFAGRLADGWRLNGKAIEHDRRDNVRVAGSMDTTIADMSRFAAALVSGRGLSRRAHDELLRPQLPITTASQFPTLQPDAPADQRRADLSAGLGVVTFSGPQGPAFLKGGHDDQTGNMVVCVRREERCVVLLGNDVRIEAAYPAIVRRALGETGAPWGWEYGPQAE